MKPRLICSPTPCKTLEVYRLFSYKLQSLCFSYHLDLNISWIGSFVIHYDHIFLCDSKAAPFSAEEDICPAPPIVDAEVSLMESIVNCAYIYDAGGFKKKRYSWLTMSDSPILNDETKLLTMISMLTQSLYIFNFF